MSGYSRKFEGNKGNERLTTDRASYIAFLEGQLEQVSANSLLVSGFSDRMEQMQTQIKGVEERVMNSHRSVKLLQQCSDQSISAQEGFQQNIENRVNAINTRMDELEKNGVPEKLSYSSGNDIDTINQQINVNVHKLTFPS